MDFYSRDHIFDLKKTSTRKQKRKKGCISGHDEPAHGERGVRQFHAKDDSKIPAHYRKGLSELPTIE